MDYRLYALHEISGKIVSAQDIVADNDDQAIEAGREALPLRPFELWCRTRRVFTSTSEGSSAAG